MPFETKYNLSSSTGRPKRLIPLAARPITPSGVAKKQQRSDYYFLLYEEGVYMYVYE